MPPRQTTMWMLDQTREKWRAARRRSFIRRVSMVLVGAAIITILLALTTKTAVTVATADLGTTLAVVNVTASLILVTITAFYAWVTHRMAIELASSHEASVRPLFKLELSSPGVEAAEGSEGVGPVSAEFTLWNLGRGTALATAVNIYPPYEEYHGNATVEPEPPPIMETGTRHDGVWTARWLDESALAVTRADFLAVLVSYQDVEGNLYEMYSVYDLAVLKKGMKVLFQSAEALYVSTLRRPRGGWGASSMWHRDTPFQYEPLYETHTDDRWYLHLELQ